jgi:hypothetical protein
MVDAERRGPNLTEPVASERARQRINSEAQNAGSKLSFALEMASDSPDRAAQLGETAITAAAARNLDFDKIARLLVRLREICPDLADDLFPKALDAAMASAEAQASHLTELGSYLFIVRQDSGLSGPPLGTDATLPGIRVTKITGIRPETSPDDVRLYLEAAVKAFAEADIPAFDAVAEYALLYQLIPMCRDWAPDVLEQSDRVRVQLERSIGEGAVAVRSALGRLGSAINQGGEAEVQRDRLAGKVLSATMGSRFAEARLLAQSVDDLGVRGQLDALIDFSEAASAIGNKQIERAAALANRMRPGVKRSLLYAGLMGALPETIALEQLQFARNDTRALPPEQRSFVLSALATVTFHVDVENALSVLSEAVVSANDAVRKPRRGQFNPRIVRQIYSGSADGSTDSALILFGNRGLYEVVDGGRGWHYVRLRVPGVSALTIAGAVASSLPADRARVEAILLGLKSEDRRQSALNALAAVYLR